MLDGMQRNWHENGQLAFEGSYKDGKLDGVIREWNADGGLIYEQYYENGVEKPMPEGSRTRLKTEKNPINDSRKPTDDASTTSGVVGQRASGTSNAMFTVPVDEAKVRRHTQSAKNNIKKFKNGDFKLDYSSFNAVERGLRKMLSLGYEGGTNYATYETPNGYLEFRLSNHNATGNNFKKHNSSINVSVYVQEGEHAYRESEIPYDEFRIPQEVFAEHTEEVVSSLVNSIGNALETGKFIQPAYTEQTIKEGKPVKGVKIGNTLFSISLDNAETRALNDKQKRGVDSEMEFGTRFSISKNNKQTISGWLAKREDLSEAERESVLAYISDLEGEGVNKNTLQLATGKWFAMGTIRLPEDMDKVRQSVRVAEKNKANVLSFKSPMELIDTYGAVEEKQARINPDNVPTLHRAKTLENGLVIYDVEESEESRQNMREILNTHFGKDSSPWCLLQGDGEGNLTKDSKKYWGRYNAYTKQVAFKDGKLVSFSANNENERVWWDRQDAPHRGIALIGKIKGDELGRSGTILYDPNTGEQVRVTKLHKGDKKNGRYQEWYDNGSLKIERNYKNGKRNGVQRWWYDNGQLKCEENYKTDKLDGITRGWHENGQLRVEENYKADKLDGIRKTWYKNGQLELEENYKAYELNGIRREWHDNGQLAREENYKADELDGIQRGWFNDGQIAYEENYKDGGLDGIQREWGVDGNLKSERYYENGVEKPMPEEHRTLFKVDGEISTSKNNESTTLKSNASGQNSAIPQGNRVANQTPKLYKNNERVQLLNNVLTLINKKGKLGNHEFIHETACALKRISGHEKSVSSSQKTAYVRLSDNTGLRISDHYASAGNYLNKSDSAKYNYGVVIKLSSSHFHDNDDVNYKEYVYFPDKLTEERQKDIINGLKQFIQNGDFESDLP